MVLDSIDSVLSLLLSLTAYELGCGPRYSRFLRSYVLSNNNKWAAVLILDDLGCEMLLVWCLLLMS